MSKFHAAVRDLVEDVYSFLSSTLQNEVLSSSALMHKEKLLSLLTTLQKDYPELQILFSVKNEQKGNRPDSSRYSPSSPVPYVDMNGGSPYKIPSLPSNIPAEGESYDVCSVKDKQDSSENQSLAESEDYVSDEVKNLPDIAACDLYSCDKSGYLDKKKRDSRKGWLNPFQKRWCAIKNGVLFYYEKTSDRKQRGSILLSGYEARPLPDDNKDGKKYNHCFELICPGKRTYHFSAASDQDLKQWIAAVEKNSKITNFGKTTNHEVQSPKYPINFELELIPHETEDIYETVEDGDGENQISEKFQTFSDENEDYSDVETVDPSNQIFNYNEWYVGLWDCTGADDTELTFFRGDLIHIVSKEYDSFAWWIGELQGKVGFVPKSYLMEAYEAC